ncbi:hypothetical protein BVC80_8693g19 [Macleaya cordata]|uniref:Cytochrome P450 n=1 Tax=Macleaya cordata TaxID=56857 RepID=A0A200PS73_MACCD|nr:hypothetical protein BVC80_8693g19 [Macleaya cordata]
MSTMETMYFFLISLPLFVLSSLLLITRKKKMNLPPSPLALPIIGHLHLIKKPLYQTLSTISNRYGSILFLQFGSSLQMFCNIRAEEVQSMIRRLIYRSAAGTDGGNEYGSVEMKPAFLELMLNIMMRVMAGKRYYGDGDEVTELDEANRERETERDV